MKSRIILTAVLVSSSVVFASSGSNGSDGYDGTNGSNGQKRTIVAKGQSAHYNVSGEDGDNGRSGSNGENASCYQPEDKFDGGNGGDGGDGGSGGDSGDITVYFADKAHLKSIYVDASPGEGGRGASEGNGGRGCNGGYDGRDGWRGRNGSDGKYGDVFLIPQLDNIAETQHSETIAIKDLDFSTTLTRTQWETRANPASLFAPGSRMKSTASVFAGIRTYPVRVEWRARRPKTDFPKAQLIVSAGSENVGASVYGDILAKVVESKENDLHLIQVKDAFTGYEVSQVEISGFAGDSAARSLVLKDAMGISNQVKSQITLTLKSQGFLGVYSTRFSGRVPEGAMKVSSSIISIDLTKLGIKAKELASGKKARVEMQIYRTFGEGSRSKNLRLEAKLP